MSHQPSSSPFSAAKILHKTALWSGTALGAIALVNAIIAARTPPLGFRLGGEFGRYPARFGDIAYTVGGSGAPILLLHGLGAGRSMAEWRAIFGPLCENYTVYALDFPGWGLSDATREGINATDFAEVIAHFIRDIIGGPTTVVAAGEAGIFAALAARSGAPIERLILSCPIPPALDAPSGESRAEALLQRAMSGSLLNAPVLGTAALNWNRSRSNLSQRARTHGFFDKALGERESELWHTVAHQRGADLGQKSLLQGAFGCDWRAAWSDIEVPSLLIWGRNALREGYASAPEWLTLRPDAHLEVVENTLLFPHLEQPGRFLELVSSSIEDGK